MKTLFLILGFSSTLVNACLAQSSVWKIEGKGNTVFVGGTMHLLTPEDYPLPFEFDSAFAWSDVLVFEADIKKMENPAVIQRMMILAMYQDDRTLESELSKEAYNLLESECAKMNLSLRDFAKFKPSLVMLIYTVTKLQQSGMIEAGVDQHYLSMARDENKETLFLETIEDQLNLLFGEDEENEDQLVFQFFEDQKKMDRMGEDIKDSWRSGKPKLFVRIQKQMEKEYPEIYGKILADRNDKWIAEIDSYFDSEPVEFVLVGALHLHGPDGILNQLKKRGYSLSQL